MRIQKARLRKLEKAWPRAGSTRVVFGAVEPFLFWDVYGIEIEDGHRIERIGSRYDYRSIIDLKEVANAYCGEMEKTPNVSVMWRWLKEGHDVSVYKYDGVIPQGLTNTHLCQIQSYRAKYEA